MKKLLALLTIGFLALPMSLHANVSTSGSLTSSSDNFDLFNFHIGTAGVTNFYLDGDTDAYLFLFSGTNDFSVGAYIAEDDDSGAGFLDSQLILNLGVGDYTAYITTHGSVWTGSSFQTFHDHTPMNYTLTISGDVSQNGVPDGGSSLLLLGMAACSLAMFKRSKA
jgi:hypothetical protein